MASLPGEVFEILFIETSLDSASNRREYYGSRWEAKAAGA